MSERKKLNFVVVFLNIIRREVLPKWTSMHTGEITEIKIAMKKIYNRENKWLVIYRKSHGIWLSIEFNKETPSTLNWIYNILAEFQNQENISYYVKSRYMWELRVKRIKKTTKEAIQMPGIALTRLPYTDYYLIIR